MSSELLRQMQTDLEQVYGEVQWYLDLTAVPRVRVEPGLAENLAATYLRGGGGHEILINPQSVRRGPAYLKATLVHELTHALLFQEGAPLPAIHGWRFVALSRCMYRACGLDEENCSSDDRFSRRRLGRALWPLETWLAKKYLAGTDFRGKNAVQIAEEVAQAGHLKLAIGIALATFGWMLGAGGGLGIF
jgi:hypothetical protein